MLRALALLCLLAGLSTVVCERKFASLSVVGEPGSIEFIATLCFRSGEESTAAGCAALKEKHPERFAFVSSALKRLNPYTAEEINDFRKRMGTDVLPGSAPAFVNGKSVKGSAQQQALLEVEEKRSENPIIRSSKEANKANGDRRWPYAKVQYYLDKEKGEKPIYRSFRPHADALSPEILVRFAVAVQDIQKNTCISFEEKPTFDFKTTARITGQKSDAAHKDFRRCSSWAIGKEGPYSLDVMMVGPGKPLATAKKENWAFYDGCDQLSVSHELFHLLGMRHTHQRLDRDKFFEFDLKANDDFYKKNPNDFVKADKEVYEDSKLPGLNKVEQTNNFFKSYMLYPTAPAYNNMALTVKPNLELAAYDHPEIKEGDAAALAKAAEKDAKDRSWSHSYITQPKETPIVDVAALRQIYSCYEEPRKVHCHRSNGEVEEKSFFLSKLHTPMDIKRIVERVCTTEADQEVWECEHVFYKIKGFVTKFPTSALPSFANMEKASLYSKKTAIKVKSMYLNHNEFHCHRKFPGYIWKP